LLLSGPAVALGWRGNDGIAPLDYKVLDFLKQVGLTSFASQDAPVMFLFSADFLVEKLRS
jgi:hypothetical protein